ncbi:MAG: hydrogenase maturation protease [Actinomycetota bacterium]|nr:hydrogenase maturation protease [Actinomycetota bacterium]
MRRHGERLLVAGVGNPLRGDDGFGPAVADRLEGLPEPVEVIETGIGGIALLQELMAGCEGLILVDAVDHGAAPGTVFLITPEVGEAEHVADVHLANPDRVLTMAKALGALPERLLIVGCQPADVDELVQHLSPAVERAVSVAVARIEETVRAWLEELPAQEDVLPGGAPLDPEEGDYSPPEEGPPAAAEERAGAGL